MKNRIEIIFLLLAAVTAMVCVVWWAVPREQYGVMCVAAVLPLVCLSFNSPRVLLTLALVSSFAQFIIPGIPGYLTVGLLLMSFLAVILFGKSVIAWSFPRPNFPRVMTLMLFVWILALIAVRGIGVRVLGGGKWGGGDYIATLPLMFFFLLLPSLPRCSPKFWNRMFIVAAIGAFIPSMVSLLYIFSDGQIYHLFYVIKVYGTGHVVNTRNAVEMGAGIARYHIPLWPIIAAPVLLFRMDFRSYRFFGVVLFALLALAAALATGARSSILGFLFLITCVYSCQMGRFRLLRFVSISAAGLAAILVLGLFTSQMPEGAQRTLAFLPYADIDPVVRNNVENSNQWRLLLWENAVGLIPEYFWFGRGRTFDGELASNIRLLGGNFISEYWFITGNWHNGPLSMLIDLGLPGALLMLTLLVGSCVCYSRPFLNRKLSSAYLMPAYVMSFMLVLSGCVMFIINGTDIGTFLPQFYLKLVMLDRIHDSLSMELRENEWAQTSTRSLDLGSHEGLLPVGFAPQNR